MTDQPEWKRLTLRVTMEFAERLERIAERQYRSVHGEMLYLLEMALEAEEKKYPDLVARPPDQPEKT